MMPEDALLTREVDGKDVYIEITGFSGAEAQDWASMIMRMYLRWAEKRGFKTEIIESIAGEEAGIQFATILIKGKNAYGLTRAESGIHRLVRIPPFDSLSRRCTSFAAVEAYPFVADDIEVDLSGTEESFQVFSNDGLTVTSRITVLTHHETGIVAEYGLPSQQPDAAGAWRKLRSLLYEEELLKREEEDRANVRKRDGLDQVRVYVFHPEPLVKDLKTGMESTNPPAVLDGELEPFIEAALVRNKQTR